MEAMDQKTSVLYSSSCFLFSHPATHIAYAYPYWRAVKPATWFASESQPTLAARFASLHSLEESIHGFFKFGACNILCLVIKALGAALRERWWDLVAEDVFLVQVSFPSSQIQTW